LPNSIHGDHLSGVAKIDQGTAYLNAEAITSGENLGNETSAAASYVYGGRLLVRKASERLRTPGRGAE
jgi:hypothetical protein